MKLNLPAGIYYVGDPCYIFKGEKWDDVLSQTGFFDSDNQLINGIPVLADNTAYGDGSYEDQAGRTYWVDAGLIGILPISLVEWGGKTTVEEISASKGMHIVEFLEDFEATAEDGIFNFGNQVLIDTKNEDEDENDEDENGWDDEDWDSDDDY